MYYFGYYYHLPLTARLKSEIVLLMKNGMFSFMKVDNRLIPFKVRDMSSNYYDLSMPVLCHSIGNTITEVIFLSDVPFVNEEKHDGFSFDLNIDDKSSVLKYNDQPFIDYNIDDCKDVQFAHLIEGLVGAKKRIGLLKQTVAFITPGFFKEKDIEQIVSALKRIIESYDLEKILSSLSVVVTDHYRSKIGGDDTYWIDRTANLEDKTTKTDEYIDKIIGIGTKCIHRDSGYTSNLRAYAPNVYIGEYSGLELEKEKERILSKYSREEHMAYLIFSKLDEKKMALNELGGWNNKIEEIERKLNEEFCVDKLSHIDERFFGGSYNVEISELLENVNNLIRRIILNLPSIRIIFSGALPAGSSYSCFGYSSQKKIMHQAYVRKINQIIEDLLQKYNVEIITGNAEGAEGISLRYAIGRKVKFVNMYTDWTMLNKDRKMERFYEMVKMADKVFLTDYNIDSYLYKNFVVVAKELNIPIEIIRYD